MQHQSQQQQQVAHAAHMQQMAAFHQNFGHMQQPGMGNNPMYHNPMLNMYSNPNVPQQPMNMSAMGPQNMHNMVGQPVMANGTHNASNSSSNGQNGQNPQLRQSSVSETSSRNFATGSKNKVMSNRSGCCPTLTRSVEHSVLSFFGWWAIFEALMTLFFLIGVFIMASKYSDNGLKGVIISATIFRVFFFIFEAYAIGNNAAVLCTFVKKRISAENMNIGQYTSLKRLVGVNNDLIYYRAFQFFWAWIVTFCAISMTEIVSSQMPSMMSSSTYSYSNGRSYHSSRSYGPSGPSESLIGFVIFFMLLWPVEIFFCTLLPTAFCCGISVWMSHSTGLAYFLAPFIVIPFLWFFKIACAALQLHSAKVVLRKFEERVLGFNSGDVRGADNLGFVGSLMVWTGMSANKTQVSQFNPHYNGQYNGHNGAVYFNPAQQPMNNYGATNTAAPASSAAGAEKPSASMKKSKSDESADKGEVEKKVDDIEKNLQ